MTTTTPIQVTQEYKEIADSNNVSALTIHNQTCSRLEIYIGEDSPENNSRGIYIKGHDERLYSGFTGKIYVRGLSSKPQTIVVIAS